MNLAVNARDAMPTGGTIIIETSLVQKKDPASIDGAETRPYAVLAVADTGTGMDEATKERIFEPFFTTKGAGKGTGLGLSMVHGIVEQSGGSIEVLSQLGTGTTFKIYLPALKAPLAKEREGAVPTQDYRGKETILVVEDQAEVREYVVTALKGFGYRVIPAPNAGEALLIFEREGDQIDLVLTDVVMPYSSGYELATRLKAIRRRVKILFMSGYADDVLEKHGVSQEGTAFINKPFTPQELAMKVRSVIAPAATAARILIADGNAGVRSYLRVVLASTGYTIAEFAGGQTDIRAALAQLVDVLVMDVAMMDPAGEMIRALRRDFPDLGIILISGALAGESSLDLEALGADAVLSKPISPALFLSKIAEVLAIRP
jgi:CheY-like chemotaxis protein